jgi:Flp pilus assembly protein TadG
MRRAAAALAAHVQGMALLEFAMAMPVLLTLYLGGYVLSDAIACNRKVTITARTLTDLATRCPAIIQSTSSTDPCAAVIIMAASSQIMVPYRTSATWERISEVQVSSATQAKVIWSEANTGAGVANGVGQPLAVAATITLPANMATTGMIPNPSATPPVVGAYLIVGEVGDAYVPPVSLGTTGTINLYDNIYMSPRLSDQVPLQ